MKWDLPNTVICGIYKLTNKINNKFYIGQAEDIYHRFKTHFWVHGDHHNSAIDAAIHKYGLENFELEILEECPKELLNDREIYWGEEYFNNKCYAPDGYNIALLGGNLASIKNCQEVSKYTLEGELVTTYISYASAGRDHEVSDVAIKQAVLRQGTCCGFMWCNGKELKIPPYESKRFGYKVCAYNAEREIELEFKTQAEAARYFDSSPTAISNYIKHKPGYVNCRGYYLARAGEEPIIRERLKNVRPDNGRKVYQYNINDKSFIQCFSSIKAAAESLNCDKQMIRDAAYGLQNNFQNFIWSFQKYDIIPNNYQELNQEFIKMIKGDNNE